MSGAGELWSRTSPFGPTHWFEGAGSSTWRRRSSSGRARSAACVAASAATSRARRPTSLRSLRASELVKMSLPRVRRCSTAWSPSCCISPLSVPVETFFRSLTLGVLVFLVW